MQDKVTFQWEICLVTHIEKLLIVPESLNNVQIIIILFFVKSCWKFLSLENINNNLKGSYYAHLQSLDFVLGVY